MSGKISENTEGFYFVISVTFLKKPNAVNDDVGVRNGTHTAHILIAQILCSVVL
jgi:hypothetical protein